MAASDVALRERTLAGSEAGEPLEGDIVPPPTRGARGALRLALGNDGIRRLGLSWTLGIAADSALTVVTVVTVFNRGGVVPAALLGAVRMVPAIISGMFAGSLIERFRGDRILIALGLIRALAAVMIGLAIMTAGPTVPDHEFTLLALFLFSTIGAAANAPVRPTQITLMPAIARGTDELVAANTVWSTGEGLGAFVGPFIAGILMGLNLHEWVAYLAGLAFLLTAVIAMGLRFEQTRDATGGAARTQGSRFRILDGLRAVRAHPLLSWSLFGMFWQVVTRFLLNALVVVAAIDLLALGQSGAGLLVAAMGFGGLVGAVFAMTSRQSERLVRNEIISLFFWGAPLAVIGLFPDNTVALLAMVVVGVANATYDVALFTLLQRASSNDDRAPVLSVLEMLYGIGAILGSLLAPVLVVVLGSRAGLIVTGLLLPIAALLMYLRIGRMDHVTVVDDETVRLLRHVPAFAALPLNAVERLAGGLQPFSAPAGTALMTQGEPGDQFLVIETGEIEVSVDGKGVNRLGPGAGVGEIALLRQRPRTATVVATTDVTGYGIDASTFLAAVAGPAACVVTERMVQTHLLRAAAVEPAS